jgi:poly(3-hydroxybutyrate) depolymerase
MKQVFFRLKRGGAFLIALAALVPSMPAAAAQDSARNPFTVPHKYTSAVQMLHLKGIVRTENYSGAIVQVGEGENVAVFRTGQRIRLDLDDRVYEFTVAVIKEKSVEFKSGEGRIYEVAIR